MISEQDAKHARDQISQQLHEAIDHVTNVLFKANCLPYSFQAENFIKQICSQAKENGISQDELIKLIKKFY